MASTLCLDGLTDIGNRRQNNEDAWWVGQLGGPYMFMEPLAEPLRVQPVATPSLMLVSDGMGGANAGEVASQMASQRISAALTDRRDELQTRETALAAIRASLEEANTAIVERSREPGYDGMGATISLLCFANDTHVYWGNAGDSRIYRFQAGKLRQLSSDHSPIGRLRMSGKLSEAEARSHPLRHEIDQSLGDPEATFAPDLGCEAYAAGDVFLICSDGLSDGLWEAEIAAELAKVRSESDVRPTVQRLIGCAKAASGRDNITAVIAFVANAPLSPPPAGNRWLRFFRR